MSFIDSRLVGGPDGQNVNDKLNDHAAQLAEKAQQTDVDISSSLITNNLQMLQSIQSMGVKMSD